VRWCLEILCHVLRIEPADFVEGCPEFAGLVDVDAAGLLCVRLAKLFADTQFFEAAFEDASLAVEVGCARQAKGRCQSHLVRMKSGAVRVV